MSDGEQGGRTSMGLASVGMVGGVTGMESGSSACACPRAVVASKVSWKLGMQGSSHVPPSFSPLTTSHSCSSRTVINHIYQLYISCSICANTI